jgi:hypothetical protein
MAFPDDGGSLNQCGSDTDCAPNEFCDASFGNYCVSGNTCSAVNSPPAKRAAEQDLGNVFKKAMAKKRMTRERKY